MQGLIAVVDATPMMDIKPVVGEAEYDREQEVDGGTKGPDYAP